MASSLPDSPSLEKLRAQARTLQRAWRSADPRALEYLTREHPRPDVAAAQGFPLAAAQLVVARSYGFTGWPALRAYLDQVAVLGRTAPDDDSLTGDVARFCALACLRSDRLDSPPRWVAARDLLQATPDLTERSIHAAAAAGDAAAVRQALAAGVPVDQLGGSLHWTPLMSLTYARIEVGDPLATAAVLLDAGADADAGILWGGLATPFTVLTGVFGEGEMGAGRQPAHPQWQALATLLLDGGAEANDAQTLYNRMFRRGSGHLELLFAYGLGTGDGGPWRRRLGAATESIVEMMQRQVDWALDHAMADRLELLAQHGFGPGPAGISADVVRDGAGVPDGRTALHEAAWDGDLERITTLLEAGADPRARDAEHHTSPREWAEFAYQDAAADLLRVWEEPR
ncbi:MAG: hypothetical protein WKF57_13535 [Nakamurella sp.]